ncbi:SGS domain containing protein [Tritrichomonas foetus]|uniref:SGS domain containing protein n=1 Tax=Tritrichomonas foetus TaxID=1144522 RepID=A0A1J4KU82_9EUKA|nr:SGS domain containing protein [Tritrichomonas foetus]|eukprot:OHT14464.1 SGS domain containing protein [Tritrichomonas foetus]
MTEVEPEFPCNTDSYQTQKSVAVVVYIRGHTVENLITHPEAQSLTIEVDIDGKHCMKAWAFYGEVNPSTLKVDRSGATIEIIIQKVTAVNWPRALSSNTNVKPLYEKWRQVQLPDEEEDKNEGLDHFLQKIYKDATPEARRAMMKSFTESGGTVLSTNWEDVGSRKVEPQPPK